MKVTSQGSTVGRGDGKFNTVFLGDESVETKNEKGQTVRVPVTQVRITNGDTAYAPGVVYELTAVASK